MHPDDYSYHLAGVRILEDGGHFSVEEFPEIVADIKFLRAQRIFCLTRRALL